MHVANLAPARGMLFVDHILYGCLYDIEMLLVLTVVLQVGLLRMPAFAAATRMANNIFYQRPDIWLCTAFMGRCCYFKGRSWARIFTLEVNFFAFNIFHPIVRSFPILRVWTTITSSIWRTFIFFHNFWIITQYMQWLKWGGKGAQSPVPISAPAIVWAPDWIYKVLYYSQITLNLGGNGYGVCSSLASSGEPFLLHMATLTTEYMHKYKTSKKRWFCFSFREPIDEFRFWLDWRRTKFQEICLSDNVQLPCYLCKQSGIITHVY